MKKFLELLKESDEEWLGTEDHSSMNVKLPSYLNLHKKKDLNDEEDDSLAEYSDTGHKYINKALRTEIPDGTEESVRHLDSAIAKHTTEHPAHVWRGVDNKTIDSLKLNNKKSGTILHDKGFVSTSFNPTKAYGFTEGGNHLIHIKVPKGSKALYRTHYINNSHEDEVILPRDSKFRYDGSEKHQSKQMKFTIHHLTHLPEGHNE